MAKELTKEQIDEYTRKRAEIERMGLYNVANSHNANWTDYISAEEYHDYMLMGWELGERDTCPECDNCGTPEGCEVCGQVDY